MYQVKIIKYIECSLDIKLQRSKLGFQNAINIGIKNQIDDRERGIKD